MESAASQPRVLVTGASGFTGRYVVQELLAHGWQVSALLQSAATPQESLPVGVTPLYAHLLDAPAVAAAVRAAQPQAVIHLAAVAFVAHGQAQDFYQVNLIGTRNLLAALAELRQQPARVLLASSANVYGNAAAGRLGEDTPMRPANDYAVSKAAMEMMAQLWAPALPLLIVRPFNYTGVGQGEQYLVPKIVAHFRRRAAQIELGNLHVWRDFSDVRYVAAVYRRLLQAPMPASGSILNIGSGQLHSLGEIIEMAQNLTGHTLQVRVNPAFVRANEVRELCADTTALQAALGQPPLPPIALRDTLAWMLQETPP